MAPVTDQLAAAGVVAVADGNPPPAGSACAAVSITSIAWRPGSRSPRSPTAWMAPSEWMRRARWDWLAMTVPCGWCYILAAAAAAAE